MNQTFFKVQDIIKAKPYLAWFTSQYDQLSAAAVLEQIINYGDWDDVQAYIKLLGMKKLQKYILLRLINQKIIINLSIKIILTNFLKHMHQNILSKKQNDLLPLIKEFNSSYGLVGGIAIALQIGHRQSVDFDLFTEANINQDLIRKKIKKLNLKIRSFNY